MWSAAFHPLPLLPWCVVLLLASWAALAEARGGRVPRAVLGACLALALGSGSLVGGASGAAHAALAGLALALPYGLLALAARGGWRDAGLMGVVGAWLGLHDGAVALLSISLAGLLYALGFAMHRRRLAVALASTTGVARVVMWSVLGADSATTGAPTGTGGAGGLEPLLAERIPYGPAVFAGLLISACWRVLS